LQARAANYSEFYKHPARNIFGSYSTYVDWYAGGKARKEQERDLYSKARSGQWTPTEHAPFVAGPQQPIHAGGMATSGISGTDIYGRSTVKAPGGEGMVAAPDVDTMQRISDVEAAEYNRQVEAAKRKAYSPEDRVAMDKQALELQKVEQAQTRLEQSQQRITQRSTIWEEKQAHELDKIKKKYDNDIAKAKTKDELDVARMKMMKRGIWKISSNGSCSRSSKPKMPTSAKGLKINSLRWKKSCSIKSLRTT